MMLTDGTSGLENLHMIERERERERERARVLNYKFGGSVYM